MGTERFHKQASASSGDLVPDKILKAHFRVADEMEKVAGILSDHPSNISYAHALKEAATYVRRGYPAKSAMFVSLGGSEKLSKKANNILNGIGQDIILGEIAKSLQQKTAGFVKRSSVIDNDGINIPKMASLSRDNTINKDQVKEKIVRLGLLSGLNGATGGAMVGYSRVKRNDGESDREFKRRRRLSALSHALGIGAGAAASGATLAVPLSILEQ